MSNDIYDLDDILAEFSGAGDEAPDPSAPEEPALPELENLLAEFSGPKDREPEPHVTEKPVQPEPSAPEEPALPELEDLLTEFSGPKDREPEPHVTEKPVQPEPVEAPHAEPALPEEEYDMPEPGGEEPPLEPITIQSEELPPLYARGEKAEPRPSRFRKAPRESLNAPEKEKPAKKQKAPKERREAPPRRRFPGGMRVLLGMLFAGIFLGTLIWTIFNLHPASGKISSAASDARLRLAEKLDVYVNNAASDALGDLAYIRKIYTLQESDTVSPKPDPTGFGTTEDPAEIMELIRKASVLLDGQEVTFDPKADFVPSSPIRYYLDDTILVIAWQEYIQQRCCTFAEVKIAHGSQLRRKLAEDSYSSSVQLYASDMASASNAVVAMNGDFYAFRDLGITVYQRKIYRNNPEKVDSCFFTASGDMLFTRAGELTGEGEAEKFIEDNDVVFSVAFGPVLVDEGELQYCSAYPIGEINIEYSRSCIAMTDELHYLLMTINHTPDARPRATINELARIIYSKNVWKAYTLDGGQTAEIVMMGGPINHVDFGYERVVSDIIYFATALPEEVRS